MPLRGVPLRRRLLLLAAAGIVPLAAMSGVGLLQLAQAQRAQADHASIEIARALGTAVDAELRRSIAVLETMATSLSLDRGDLARFGERASRLAHSQNDWRTVLLASPSGRLLLNAGPNAHRGTVDGPAEPTSFELVLDTRSPVVGPMTRGPGGHWGVPVRVPVLRDGELRYVLTGVLEPDAILRVVKRQRAPVDWVLSVFDSAGQRVARSRRNTQTLGQPATPSLQALMHGQAVEGSGISRSADGERMFTAYSRPRGSDWLVAIGVPMTAFEAGVNRSLLIYGGGIALSLLLAALAALLVARSIIRPIADLRGAAQALGRGETPRPPASPLNELREVAEALTASAQQRARAESEREALLSAERRARDAAEQAGRRLERLAGAGNALSRSLDALPTLQVIRQIVVPDIADACHIELFDADGRLLAPLPGQADPSTAAMDLGPLREAMAGTQARPRYVAARGSGDGGGNDNAHPALARFVHDNGLNACFIVPLVAHGRALGAMAVLQTTSARTLDPADRALIVAVAQRAALALDNARLYGEAEAARRQAETANRAKDEFLAMLGHELRNPLAPIVTTLHLLERRGDPATQRERRIIERQVAHLSQLVDDLLDVSRITRGKIALQREAVDLRSVVARALELVQPALAKRARPVELDLGNAPVVVQGDPLRLAQVLCNLLTNAAKFTPGDALIAVSLDTHEGRARMTVQDQGAGIAPELLPHVFDLFTQGTQDIDRGSGGLGLGLSITRTLVQMHGGSVQAWSEGPQRGSRFVVELPLAGDEPVQRPAPAPAAAARGPARLLVVDDNRDAADTLAQLLQELGYEVRTAGDGPQALAVLDDFVPALAVLDIGLPGMDGYELARRLRDDPRGAGLRLVALTGYGRDPDRTRAMAARFDEHLVKPVAVERLLDVLDRLLGTA